jgi:hypothetical protein
MGALRKLTAWIADKTGRGATSSLDRVRAPAVSRPAAAPNDPPEIATARDFVQRCELVLAALDAHWYAVATGLPAIGSFPHDFDDIPF